VVIHQQDSHAGLIGRERPADKGFVRHEHKDDYQAWLWGEVLLIGLLGAALALFVAYPSLRNTYSLPHVRLVLDTAVMLAAGMVAVLAAIRFSVDGRRLDLLLCGGFTAIAATTLAFAIAPVLGNGPLHRTEAWAGTGGKLFAMALIAAAPFSKRRTRARGRPLGEMLVAVAIVLILSWSVAHQAGSSLPPLTNAGGDQPFLLMSSFASLALLSLIAMVGFGLRFRSRGNDLDRWLCLGATLALFAELHYVFTPFLSSRFVSQGDFLRVLSYSVLLVGVWRAIRYAEFGRAVAEERARVAREIHDGLAQYLFAVSTHASVLESGATDPAKTLAQLKDAAAAAQQEARFAVLALSSAGGSAPFDSALRRYVDFLTADGLLEVDLEIQDGISLAPDEQIEIFRIVQEGLANARRHAGAERALVEIAERAGERFVSVADDGAGFDQEEIAAGQGLKNMRARAASIGGGFRLVSAPGRGTALEVVLRA